MEFPCLHKLIRFGKKPSRPRLRSGVKLSVECLEDRCVPAIIHVGPTEPFTTIQAGVNAASAGDTVLVDPGTYVEQVKITVNNLTLEGSNQASIIEAPATMTSPKAIVEVSGAQHVTIENFTIEGPGSGPFDSLEYGIRVDGGGSALITNNHITHIRDSTLGNSQTGIAIDIGQQAAGTTGSATITHNVIDDYQKGGILVDNTGSSAVIVDNTVTGSGPTTVIAQNGIQISDGANASVSGNTITGNQFTPAPQAAGILLFDQGAVTVHANRSNNNDYGIFDQGGQGEVISNNQATGNTLNGIILFMTSAAKVDFNVTNGNGSNNPGDGGIALYEATGNNFQDNRSGNNHGDGIFVDSGSTGNLFAFNVLKGNANLDAEDDSAGAGTGGTANTWSFNLGNTSNAPDLVLSQTTLSARPRWGKITDFLIILRRRILTLRTPLSSVFE
jgi:nitrous oxidase accessory protein NosD